MRSSPAKWTSGANWSRVIRMDLIKALGGRSRPSKLSIEDLGVGAGDVDQLSPQLVRVVRQRFDLFARHHAPERDVAIRRGGLPVARDGDVGLEPIDRQHHGLLVLARAHADVREGARLESRELGGDRIPSRREVREGRLPLLVGCRCPRGRGLGGRFCARKRHVRAGQYRPRFIDHRHEQRAVAVRLGERLARGEKGNGSTVRRRAFLPPGNRSFHSLELARIDAGR